MPQLFGSTRPMSLALSQNKNLSVLVYVEAFWWAQVDVASRASKKAPRGLFCSPDYSAGRCCSNPPSRVRLKMPGKTKNQRNFYAGSFGGRGWMSRAAHLKKPRRGFLPAGPFDGPMLFESTRPVSLALQQNKNLSVLSYVEVFWWARVDSNHRS